MDNIFCYSKENAYLCTYFTIYSKYSQIYAQWIAEHPDKQVFNNQLGKYIHVKFLSINETYEKASRSYESTLAVFKLSEILENAVIIKEKEAKKSTKNQKQFEKIIVMKFGSIRLTVGLQRSNHDLVQYCITVPTQQSHQL
ncbi:MAG: hypothetical protein IJ633_06960 [Prevotella sp.]|nr:hypothetical protein [Prevotella sp.]